MRGHVFSFSLMLLFASTGLANQGRPFRIAGFYSTKVTPQPNSTYSIEAGCVARAVVEEARKQGLNITIDIVDTRGEPLRAHHAAKKVIALGYNAAIGTLISAEALAVAPLLEKARVPFLVPTATHPAITEGRKFVIRTTYDDDLQAIALAKLVANDLDVQKLVVVPNLSDPYSERLTRGFVRTLRQIRPGTQIHEEPVLEDSSDFGALAARILARHPQLVFLPLWETEIASLYVELRQRDARLTVLSGDTIIGRDSFLKLLGPISPQIRFVFTDSWRGRPVGSRSDRYQELLKSHCGGLAPSRVSAATYDAVSLLVEAVRKSPSAHHASFVSVIQSTKFDGVTGPLRFSNSGKATRPIEVFTIRGNDFHHWGTHW